MGWSHLGVLVLGLCCAVPVVWGQGYVNIAPWKTYNQSGAARSSYLASNAVDGDTSKDPYFITTYLYRPFWEVDLGRKYPVQNINVWGRDSINDYLTPFNITVDGQHCVTVNSTQASNRNISVTCSSLLYGQRVRLTRIYTRNTYLRLCEFEILVPSGNSRCDEGRWGPQCQYYCDNNCGGRAGTNFCYQSTLNCYDECVAGRWGERCQKRCGQNCVTGNCDVETGNCSACIAGWYGEQCNKTCPSHSCLLNTCHQTTGRCLACHTGYDGENCTECGQGFSKNNTASCSPCSAFCNTGRCDAITGNCTNGCRPGYHGQQCNESCSTLADQCVQCTQGGQCTACSGHFLPPQCTECVAGRWGDRCQNRCGQNCVTRNCDPKSGNCSACMEGFYLEAGRCRVCPWSCHINTFCNQSTGACDRCPTGREGPWCLQRVKDESLQQSSVPVVGAILGAGLMLTVAVLSVLVFLCWKHRSQKTVQDAEPVAASSSDPVTAPNNVYTAPPTASPSTPPSASAQACNVTPHEIRDPGNTYEQLRIYSNMVFDREAHSDPEPRGTDVTTALSTSEHVHVSVEHIYANTSSATEERKPRKKKAK